MEHLFKKTLAIAMLLSGVSALADNKATPTLVYRSQGFHADRQKMVGMVGHTDMYDGESWYGTFDLGVGYMRSFREDRIARCLFGEDLNCSDCPPTIKVQGSSVSSRESNAWLADNLYLPCNFDGSFSVSPRIQNVVVDLDFYLGLDEWVNGMYFRLYGPINWTKWELNFCEKDNTFTNTCPEGYFAPTGGSGYLLESITSYFSGSTPTQASGDNITYNGLKKAKIDCACDNTKTGFADLRMVLGWNFLQDEDYHLGLNIQAAAPTGNQRDGTQVMQPVVGNGNHWELGGGLGAHWVFWKSEDEEKHFGFYLDANVSHMFKATENRTFDLNDKDNSRYMLASKFTATNTGNLTGSNLPDTSADTRTDDQVTAPSKQFAREYAPLANLSTLDVKVSVGVQADIVAMFNFTARGFSWDLGYDFWGRTCEDIKCPDNCEPCGCPNLCTTGQENTWALKGDSQMFGFDFDNNDDPVALSASQSKATIRSGTNATATSSDSFSNLRLRNIGIDNARFAYGDASGGTANGRLLGVPGGVDGQIHHVKTSVNPIFLKCCDLATEQQETRGISHTVFTHLSYTWDRDNWVPYLGIGGSVEFGKSTKCASDCDTSTSCDECKCVDCALSQWSVWVKGGLSFN